MFRSNKDIVIPGIIAIIVLSIIIQLTLINLRENETICLEGKLYSIDKQNRSSHLILMKGPDNKPIECLPN